MNSKSIISTVFGEKFLNMRKMKIITSFGDCNNRKKERFVVDRN